MNKLLPLSHHSESSEGKQWPNNLPAPVGFHRFFYRLLLISTSVAIMCSNAQSQTVNDWITEYSGSPLYPAQHGQLGHPGYVAGDKTYGNLWGFPERTAYPGSVEHVRVELQRYIPVAPIYNTKTLVRNWRATELPGVAKERVTPYAEPIYYVPAYRGPDFDAYDTGQHNAPVDVVKWRPNDAAFNLDMGTLQAGRPYVLRVIAATPKANVQRDSLRLVVNCEINDGDNGEVHLYRKRVAAIDEFYSVAEFFFWAPQNRAYTAKLSLDASTKLPELLVYNFDLHDQFAQIAYRAVKKSASLYDTAARAAAWKSKDTASANRVLGEAERAARDRGIWNQMPPLNAQVSEGLGASNVVGQWWDYSRAPIPAGQKDDGLGVDLYDTPAAKAHGISRQTAYPVATQRRDALHTQRATLIELAKKYHETGDSVVGRDAAMYLASVAWKLPTEDAKQTLYMYDIIPTFEAEPNAFRRRPRNFFYSDTIGGMWSAITESYDYLFPLIQNNPELASAVGRFLPWIKTPADLQQFFDATLLQYRARELMTYNAYADDPVPAWISEIAAVQQDSQVTKPWMDWLFHYVWTYPNPPLGVDQLMVNNIQRDGTHKVGSLFYTKSGNFATDLVGLLSTYKKFGGTLPYDIADIRKFPKAVAMTYFPIEGRVAGGHIFQIGDVGGPDEPRFSRWMDAGDINLFRLGWKLTRDPRFAYLIVNYIGRGIESDAEWAEVQKAAVGQRNPVFAQGSRVLSDWFGLLSTGVESDDFRFRRAAGLRVGEGYGHDHDDPLDLQIWAHGVQMATDTGQRPGYVQPPAHALLSHNTLVSPQAIGRRWISSFADVPGARYERGKVGDGDNYSRQLALIDVDNGKPSSQPLPAKDGPDAKLPTDVVTPNSYVVDVFRVRGGTVPSYAFHAMPADEFVTNVQNNHKAAPDENEILKAFNTDETKWIGTAPSTLTATWRMQREASDYKGIKMPAAEKQVLGVNFDPTAPRKFIRMHLPGYEGGTVFGARQVGEKVVNFTTDNLYVQPAKWQGQAVFPVVFEPFVGESFIQSVRLLTPQSTLANADAAVALEIILKNGRRDIVLMSPDKKSVTIPGVTACDGEFGYISRDATGVRQASIVGGTRLEASGVLLLPGKAAYEGTVKSVDYYDRTATIEGTLPERGAGSVLEIGPPQRRTSYTVTSTAGDKIVFRKGMDLGASRIQSIAPDGVSQTVSPIATEGLAVSGDDAVPRWRLGPGSKESTLRLTGSTKTKPAFKVGDMARVWEFGPGDTYRLPAWMSVTRGAQGKLVRDGNISGKVQVEE
jgi:hypothetical protein